MLTVALIVSFFPMCVVGLGEAFPGFRKRVALRFAETLIQLNSSASPVLYCYRDRRFRNAVLEMLRIRKPQGNQPHVGVGGISRREENGIHVTRSQPSDTSVVLKRSLSAPSTTGSCLDGQPLEQPSSSAKTSAMHIHAESCKRKTTRINNQSGISNNVDNPESVTHPVICRRKRLKSWDASATVPSWNAIDANKALADCRVTTRFWTMQLTGSTSRYILLNLPILDRQAHVNISIYKLLAVA